MRFALYAETRCHLRIGTKPSSPRRHGRTDLAGAPGFEPGNGEIKIPRMPLKYLAF